MIDRVAYFGFGSLVNPATLRTRYLATHDATLKGWRRVWQSRPDAMAPPIALLSARETGSQKIWGALIVDHKAHMQEVDEREAGYERVRLVCDAVKVSNREELPAELFVYSAMAPKLKQPPAPLLQSYLDAVLQGFYNRYGEAGVAHFVETTDGFERDMICDRAKPHYPRAVTTNMAERNLYDRVLRQVGVRFTL